MNANEIIIPCRLSYANIWEPKQVNGTGDPKYSCCLLIKKSDTAAIAKLKAAIEAVKKDPRALARWGGSVPKNLKLPLRDGDTEKDDENYEGCYFLNANASENRRPKIIDRACNDVLDQDEVYSGCYAKVKIGLFSYSASGNKGIGAGLEVIQKVRDGERLSGGNSTDGSEACVRPERRRSFRKVLRRRSRTPQRRSACPSLPWDAGGSDGA